MVEFLKPGSEMLQLHHFFVSCCYILFFSQEKSCLFFITDVVEFGSEDEAEESKLFVINNNISAPKRDIENDTCPYKSIYNNMLTLYLEFTMIKHYIKLRYANEKLDDSLCCIAKSTIHHSLSPWMS